MTVYSKARKEDSALTYRPSLVLFPDAQITCGRHTLDVRTEQREGHLDERHLGVQAMK